MQNQEFTILKETLGHKIAIARMSKNISQAKLAEMIDTDCKTICLYENGRQTPNAIRLFHIAAALGVDIQDLNPYQ